MSDSALTRYLLALDDESFFALIRNYLGPVKTPYNKHELIASLVEFLSREETRRRIVAYLDGDDHLILSAVALLGQPAREALFQFLQEELDYGQFHWLLANHRDRLLLIDGVAPGSVQINPLLLDALLEGGLHPESLLAGEALSQEEQECRGDLPWLSRAFAVSVLAFLREEPHLYTRTGGTRKRVAAALRERFGSYLDGTGNTDRLKVTLLALQTLGLLDRPGDDHTYLIVREGWDELAELPDNWIQALLWATLISTSLERAFDIAPMLIEFVRRVPRDRWFTGAEILRILRLGESGLSPWFSGDTPSLLADAGMLVPCRNGYRVNEAAARLLEKTRGADSGAALHANMEVTLSPDLTFRALLEIAGIARLRRFDVMPVMEITEHSLAGAARIERDHAVETLRRITGAEIPQNVAFLLERWAQRADSVRLVRGLVLRVEGETAEILESSPEFSAIPRETLGPGVYLFDPDREPLVAQVLRKMEMAPAAGVESPSGADHAAPEFRRFYQRFQQPVLATRPAVSWETVPPRRSGSALDKPTPGEPPLDKPALGVPAPDTLARDESPAGDPAESLKETLRTMAVPEEQERELTLRIEHRLILFPHQIRPDVVPRYGMEARGLDYLGKVRIAEQAIAEKELLEVIMRSAEGKPQRILVRPREMSESGGDLMLRAVQLPQGSPVRIRIRRASLVRRLSGTLLRRG